MAGRCLDCHSDILDEPQDFHTVMLAESGGRNCTRCHTDHNGPSAPLTVAGLDNFPHNTLGFSLGAHRNQPDGSLFACADCHSDEDWDLEPVICTACHSDLDPVFIQTHIEDFGEACLACHDGVDRFSGFDHARVSFQLEGRHAGLGCGACHLGARSPAELSAAPQDCAACHLADDIHSGQFGADCAACHTPEDWAQVDFDHTHTGFPLAGAHATVACDACHQNSVFQGTPTTCAACHAEPQYHLGLLGTDCAACHTSTAWNPAEFGQSHTFPITHGEQGASSCRTCHPDSLQAYTCYGCHEHNPAEIEEEHREEGIQDFADCMRCHPTGQEEEGEDRYEGDDD